MYEGKELLQHLYIIRDIIVEMEKNTNEYVRLEKQHRDSRKTPATIDKKPEVKINMDMLIIIVAVFGVVSSFAQFSLSSILWGQLIPLAICFFQRGMKTGLTKCIFACVVLSDIYHTGLALLSGEILPVLIIILAAAASVGTYQHLMKAREIYQKNHEPEIMYLRKRDALEKECYQLDAALLQHTQGWFPQKYAGLETVKYFIVQLEKGHVSTFSELRKMYDETMYDWVIFMFFGEKHITEPTFEDTMEELKNWDCNSHYKNVTNVFQCLKSSIQQTAAA